MTAFGRKLSIAAVRYGSIAAVHDHGYRHADLFAILGLISDRLSDLNVTKALDVTFSSADHTAASLSALSGLNISETTVNTWRRR